MIFSKTQKLFCLSPRADPESFVREGPTLTTFFSWWGGRGSKYYLKRTIIGPPLNAGFGLQVIMTSIAQKPCNDDSMRFGFRLYKG